MEEFGPHEIYNLVLLVATLPALGFVIWLAWIITNRLMSPEWQQRRRSAQIRKAVAERETLMAELRAAEVEKRSRSHPQL